MKTRPPERTPLIARLTTGMIAAPPLSTLAADPITKPRLLLGAVGWVLPVQVAWALLWAVAGLLGSPAPAVAGQVGEQPIETLVFVRHGEKPALGLGLLNCQGLNRALMLPDWLAANFARPDHIFAPDPHVKATELHGDGQRYDYVRPLLTIGPTAIHLGVPIDTQLPFNDPGLLADTLLDQRYHTTTIYLAWEHANIVEFATVLLTRFGSTAKVPAWENSDYNMVFVFTIDWTETPSLSFEIRSQDFEPISETCPSAAFQ